MISLTPDSAFWLPPLPCHVAAQCGVRFRVRAASFRETRRLKRECDAAIEAAADAPDWDERVIAARMPVIAALIVGWNRSEPWSVEAFEEAATFQEIMELAVAAFSAQYVSERDEKKSDSP